MAGERQLNILWTNADKTTAELMVFMYARNSMLKGWWDGVTLIIWGATAKLSAGDKDIQARLRELMELGVEVSACLTCAEELGVEHSLAALGVGLERWGPKLTEILQSGGKLITV